MQEKNKNLITKIFTLLIGIALSAATSYIVADTVINSKDVYYQDNSSLGATNVQAAIDGTCTKFSNQLTTLQTVVLDKAYPVGSVYTSTNTTNLGTLFGGTWERIKGRFLLSADDGTYKINATGGEATHTLTVNEMPSHSHELIKNVPYGMPYNNTAGVITGSGVGVWHVQESYNPFSINATGGDAPHNNMPPYIVVYMWKRTK